MNQFSSRELEDDSSKLKVSYLSTNIFKTLIVCVLGLLTLGFFFLLLYWKPRIRKYFYDIEWEIWKADLVFVEDPVSGYFYFSEVFSEKLRKYPHKPKKRIFYFFFKKKVYYFSRKYRKLKCLQMNFLRKLQKNSQLIDQCRQGLTQQVAAELKTLNALQTSSEKPASLFWVIVEILLHPVYFFQEVLIVLFIFVGMYNYALLILGFVLTTLVMDTKENMQYLRNIYSFYSKSQKVKVFRISNGVRTKLEVDLHELVIGDVVILEEGVQIPGDLVLLEGDCLVNESSITGNSVPVVKTAVEASRQSSSTVSNRKLFKTKRNKFDSVHKPMSFKELSVDNEHRDQVGEFASHVSSDHEDNLQFDQQSVCSNTTNAIFNEVAVDSSNFKPPKDFQFHRNLVNLNKNMLFQGSDCLVSQKNKSLAVVVGTHWNTFKGQMISELLFVNDPIDSFQRDFFWFLTLYTVLINLILVFCAFLQFMSEGFRAVEASASKYLEIFKISLPPSLFFIIIISTRISKNRLSKKKIRTTFQEKIKKIGRVKCLCFDKTGTLTELSFKVFGFITVENRRFNPIAHGKRELHFFSAAREFIEIMSCCHSLKMINEKLIGDPLEMELFRNTNSTLLTDHSLLIELGFKEKMKIKASRENLKRFKLDMRSQYIVVYASSFDSSKRYMKVIVKENLGGFVKVFAKGAPEVIRDMCDPSTVPSNFQETIEDYTMKGLRIIALASKKIDSRNKRNLDISRIKNSELEFQGFVLLENPIKLHTPETLCDLKNHGVGCLMITGDNIFTSINVAARGCLLRPRQSLYIASFDNRSQCVDWHFIDYKNLARKTNADPLLNEMSQEASSAENFYTGRFRGSKRFAMDRLTIEPIPESDEDKSVDEVKHSRETPLPKSIRSLSSSNKVFYKGRLSAKKVIAKCTKEDIAIALEGDVFEFFLKEFANDREILRSLMQKVRIYARANPEQKAQIVRSLKSFLGPKEFNVGFIGDGSNDFKAFREADVSLCIGEKEGSLAAHFSSPSESMATIKDFLIEGRLSLQMNLDNILMNIFKGFSELFLILIVHFSGLNLCKVDFILNTLLIYPLFFSKDSRAPPKKLTSFLPRNSIMHKEVILLLIISIFLGFVNLMAGFFFISSWDLFKSVDEIHPQDDPLLINSRFFVLNKYLLYIYFVVTITGVTALNVGYPNTTSVFRSPLFVIILLFNLTLVHLLLFADAIFPNEVLEVLTSVFRIPDYDFVMRAKVVIWGCVFGAFLFIFIKLYSFTWLFSKCKTSQENQERDHMDQKVAVFDDFKNELVEILRQE